MFQLCILIGFIYLTRLSVASVNYINCKNIKEPRNLLSNILFLISNNLSLINTRKPKHCNKGVMFNVKLVARVSINVLINPLPLYSCYCNRNETTRSLNLTFDIKLLSSF